MKIKHHLAYHSSDVTSLIEINGSSLVSLFIVNAFSEARSLTHLLVGSGYRQGQEEDRASVWIKFCPQAPAMGRDDRVADR
jgi:hypothetical protein